MGLGGALWLLGRADAAETAWLIGTAIGLVASLASTATALRRHRPTVDVIALLALGGALAVGEYFAGAVITVMLATGQLLEARAEARARRELRLLLERSPRTARRRETDGVVEIPVDDVAPGDCLVVRTGDVVPVDGRLLTAATLDESALTGEPLPAERPAGEVARSGAVNAGAPFDLLATVDRCGVHLCRPGPPRRAGPGRLGAVRPPGRQARRGVRSPDPAPRRRRLGPGW